MSSSDPVTNTSGPRHFQMDDPGTAAADAAKNGVTQASPFQSLGERPEMELDLWEGQFNLSSPTMEQFTTSLSTEDLQQLGLVEGDSSTCWGEDSAVTMGTFQHLQDQVGMLTEAQATDEERYTLVKQDNSTLSSRIFMLEEQLREAEEKSAASLKIEKKMNKEQIEKIERERQISHDNFSVRIQRLEVENGELREKTEDLRTMLDVAISEKGVVEEQLAEMQLVVLREEEQQKILREEMEDKLKGWEQEREANSNIIQEFSLEISHLKGLKLDSSETDSGCHLQDVDDTFGDLTTRIIEMESELRVLRQQNTCLMDKNQELEGEILNKGLKEGEELLRNQSHTKTLAVELEEMSENESRETVEAEISKLRACLSEQEDVNLHLQNYIDSVLLNIMERYPDILEIRTK
eukprot:TRINITY_DN17971_c0_g1_i1.p1 TRINITY_DN17971_c0_g1~~TRINITY_DN17971_c0_g1_i1.p1  ORF type:complete len:408 (-),score=146.41 TRINITY_DN17971_c0_g1_i1:22-1245(-)